MDELLNKLIEVDKSARQRVSKAEKEKSAALGAIEKKKEELKKLNEEKLASELEKENAKQKAALEKASREIDENCQSVIGELKDIYEKNCDRWVRQIVDDVIA